MVKRVCLVSSGTGGHLWPALVLSDALRGAGHDPKLVTEGRQIERELLERVGARADPLEVGGRGVSQLFAFSRGVWRARRYLRANGIDLVISTGGRTSLAVSAAARSLGLPVFLLEQNAVPGRANRVLLRFAKRMYLGLPPVREVRRSVHTGTPLRKEFGAVDRETARRRLGLESNSPVVMVTGGSQGAGILNDVVPGVLCGLRRPLQVQHIAGPGRDGAVRARYAAGLDHDVRAVVRGVALDMASLYAASDLVICRGGGGTVAELIAVGRPSVIVPYPHHRDRQQFHNGNVLARRGAARLLEEDGLDAARLGNVLGQMLADPSILEWMGARARELARPDPCAAILEDVDRLVNIN